MFCQLQMHSRTATVHLRCDLISQKWAFFYIIIYLFSVNTVTPIERFAIIFVIALVGKILIGQNIQKLQNRARCDSSLIGQ